MSKKTKRKKSSVQKPSTNIITALPEPTTPTPPSTVPPITPAITPEVRNELTVIMQELLLKTHELSFEYSTSDCREIRNCSFAEKSRELFKVVKRLNALVRKITPPPRGEYVR